MTERVSWMHGFWCLPPVHPIRLLYCFPFYSGPCTESAIKWSILRKTHLTSGMSQVQPFPYYHWPCSSGLGAMRNPLYRAIISKNCCHIFTFLSHFSLGYETLPGKVSEDERKLLLILPHPAPQPLADTHPSLFTLCLYERPCLSLQPNPPSLCWAFSSFKLLGTLLNPFVPHPLSLRNSRSHLSQLFPPLASLLLALCFSHDSWNDQDIADFFCALFPQHSLPSGICIAQVTLKLPPPESKGRLSCLALLEVLAAPPPSHHSLWGGSDSDFCTLVLPVFLSLSRHSFLVHSVDLNPPQGCSIVHTLQNHLSVCETCSFRLTPQTR